jgi:diacylglycerol kinase
MDYLLRVNNLLLFLIKRYSFNFLFHTVLIDDVVYSIVGILILVKVSKTVREQFHLFLVILFIVIVVWHLTLFTALLLLLYKLVNVLLVNLLRSLSYISDAHH